MLCTLSWPGWPALHLYVRQRTLWSKSGSASHRLLQHHSTAEMLRLQGTVFSLNLGRFWDTTQLPCISALLIFDCHAQEALEACWAACQSSPCPSCHAI